MKKITFILTCVFTCSILLVAGCSNSNSTSPYSYGNGGTNSSTNATTVTMPNLTFSPASLTIARHTTVTWYNNSGIAHTSTSDNGLWDTGNIPAGASKTTTFDSVGTFHYRCTYHAAMGMVGTIIVQ